MSALYNLEPQPTAKVVLNTTAGDILLEIFAKQTPLASRNFLQHCLDGYYNGNIFHRLVPGFIIQGGDPTGTGAGGESALDGGRPFEDEVHSRLKFNRRGLLGMANEGKDSNGSQFFLTLGDTPELQGKHTMFGRIEGDTIYNLMKMGEAELVEEGSERPLYPSKVTGSEILVNPFEDMVQRVKEAPRVRDEAGKSESGVKKRKKPAGKNVLSFGGDEEGDEEVKPVKKVKANPKLVSVDVEKPEELNNTTMPSAPSVKERSKRKERAREPEEEVEQDVMEAPRAPPAPARKSSYNLPDEDEDDEDDRPKQSKRALDATNAEIAALKASMKRTAVDTAPKEREKPKTALEAMIPSTATRGRKRGKAADERGALDIFKNFKARLEDLPSPAAPAASEPAPITTSEHIPKDASSGATNGNLASNTITTKTALPDPADQDEDLCDLHFIANCQSCKSWDDEDDGAANGAVEGAGDDDDGPGWMAHQLSFAKDTLGKDLEWKRKMAEIEVIDPREKARGILEERRRGKEGRGPGAGGRGRGRGLVAR
ncbi:hypothetical protein B0A50_03274 [Salinomyces thailandicus]|uniref:PPIase cyclophilin-type domain-containing protein n=1 Tax=Salinomyces thailandicus TaxID=706561 RepID=A0A4U0U1N8_9PEZI|nr:hypothetical protein B0A50_03274 [Salinomyces thailandica]